MVSVVARTAVFPSLSFKCVVRVCVRVCVRDGISTAISTRDLDRSMIGRMTLRTKFSLTSRNCRQQAASQESRRTEVFSRRSRLLDCCAKSLHQNMYVHTWYRAGVGVDLNYNCH